MTPLISIIIPLYNVENYIAETLQTCFHQGNVPLEILCIDDHSLDGSVAAAEIALKEAPPSVSWRLIRSLKNSGVSTARNRGIIEARGSYVFFLDADDLLIQDSLKMLLESAQNNNADFTVGNHFEFPDGDPPGTPSAVTKGAKIFENTGIAMAFCKEFPVISCNKLFRRDFLLDNAIFFTPGIPHGEDYLFMLQAVITAKKAIVVPVFSYAYRQRSSSCCYNFGKRETIKYIDVLAHMFSMLPLLPENLEVWAIMEYESKRNNILSDCFTRLDKLEAFKMANRLRNYRFSLKEVAFSGLPFLRKMMILTFYINLPLCRILHLIRKWEINTRVK